MFSLLGTTYGGNGQSNFGLPNLQGQVPIGAGQGPGLSNYDLGEQTGSETVTLVATDLPAHSHTFGLGTLQGTLRCRNERGNSRDAAGNVPAIESAGVTAAFSSAGPTDTMGATAIKMPSTLALLPAGAGAQPHANMQPFLTINYCIAMTGIYPPRP